MHRFVAPLALWLAPVLTFGASVKTWEMRQYPDFIKGRFHNVSLTADGRLVPAPKLDSVFASGQPFIWSLVEAPDGTLYAGTGHRGRVFKITPAGQSSVLWTADEPEVFALALDPKGILYAATSPQGKVYRIENGKATEYFAPGETYIFSLALGSDGALYAGTGEGGKVFRIVPGADGKGTGELYYNTGQTHVTSIAVDAQGRVLAGTEPNGILYRIAAKDRAFVLFDANLPEIRGIIPAPDGSLYIAALGGSVARQIKNAQQGAQKATQAGTPVTTITVTAEAAQGGVEIKPPTDPNAAQAAQAQSAVSTQFSPITDLAGVEKSALYRIAPDNTVDTLWTSKEENAYDLLLRPAGRVLFSTDTNGRIYGLTADRKLSLIAETGETDSTRLLSQRNGAALAATGNMGKVFRLGETSQGGGEYEAPVHDAATVARWGQLNWRSSGKVRIRTRTGNTERPDTTWSDWSAPLEAPGKVPSPNARYIQWKAEFPADPAALESVTVAYLPQNTTPDVKSITVVAYLNPVMSTAKPASTSDPSAAYTVTVSDTGEAPATSSGTPTSVMTRASSPQLNITWVAEDSDQDALTYTLSVRGEDEREWKILKRDIKENTISIDALSLSDGRYYFRVAASDRNANPAGQSRESELVSAPVLIDNTPPVLTAGEPRRQGMAWELTVDVSDSVSPVKRCEYAIDAGSWMPVMPEDGVPDSLRERFVIRLEELAAGEHVVVVRALDSADNAGTLKRVITSPAAR